MSWQSVDLALDVGGTALVGVGSLLAFTALALPAEKTTAILRSMHNPVSGIAAATAGFLIGSRSALGIVLVIAPMVVLVLALLVGLTSGFLVTLTAVVLAAGVVLFGVAVFLTTLVVGRLLNWAVSRPREAVMLVAGALGLGSVMQFVAKVTPW